MNPKHRALITLCVQIFFTMAFATAYFWLLRDIVSGRVKAEASMIDLLKTLIIFLTGNLSGQLSFWFMSSRSSQAKDEPQ